ncbi:MAG TPA: hypothetical protein VFD87_13685, partial [Phototrophicaceae bacterium]|nr:hypothetical protein [Phototrophicaceae bacterium]
ALYGLSKDDLQTRIQDALRNLERSDLGTIHSFAANLLRLYPLEAGLDPQFHEDDGSAFEQLFDEQWSLWLDQELSLGSLARRSGKKFFPAAGSTRSKLWPNPLRWKMSICGRTPITWRWVQPLCATGFAG